MRVCDGYLVRRWLKWDLKPDPPGYPTLNQYSLSALTRIYGEVGYTDGRPLKNPVPGNGKPPLYISLAANWQYFPPPAGINNYRNLG